MWIGVVIFGLRSYPGSDASQIKLHTQVKVTLVPFHMSNARLCERFTTVQKHCRKDTKWTFPKRSFHIGDGHQFGVRLNFDVDVKNSAEL